ncbi:MAG: D-3-phosphoglycerate dehydrogenase [Chloroflexi bacterium OLB13]|nr:MAG: D-3-phosphoglycerate dehydrogenase [Chloroflexi bacterium OLB13]
MPFHVLISDNVDKRAIALLQEKPDLRVTAGGDLSREQTIAALPEADALIIRSATKANAELLGYASKLKVIAARRRCR